MIRYLFVFFSLISAITGVLAVQTRQHKDVPMRVTVTHPSDRVLVMSNTGDPPRASLEIRSERGIGECRVSRTGERWPAELALRLHLRGLEQLVVQVDDHKWIGGVSSSDGTIRWNQQFKTSPEKPIERGNAAWCEIWSSSSTRESTNSQTQQIHVPLAEGEFWELNIPSTWLRDNPDTIRIAWVDFFR